MELVTELTTLLISLRKNENSAWLRNGYPFNKNVPMIREAFYQDLVMKSFVIPNKIYMETRMKTATCERGHIHYCRGNTSKLNFDMVLHFLVVIND